MTKIICVGSQKKRIIKILYTQSCGKWNQKNHFASINLCRRWPVGDLRPKRITHSPWAEKLYTSAVQSNP